MREHDPKAAGFRDFVGLSQAGTEEFAGSPRSLPQPLPPVTDGTLLFLVRAGGKGTGTKRSAVAPRISTLKSALTPINSF